LGGYYIFPLIQNQYSIKYTCISTTVYVRGEMYSCTGIAASDLTVCIRSHTVDCVFLSEIHLIIVVYLLDGIY